MARVSQTTKDRHAKLKSWFWQEMRRQAANRYQMAMDEDYYDSLQWTDAEANEVLSRGQFPVSWNEIKPTVDWLLGTERRTRTDFKIIARNDSSEEAQADAELKTKFLKYLDDVNRAQFERSDAFDDAIKAGLGWIEVGVRGDPEQDPVYMRKESWRWMLYDSLGERRDLEDARYLFRFRWVDLDIAQAYFPGNDAKLEKAACPVGNEPYMQWWHGRRIEEYTDMPVVNSDKWRFYDASSWLNNPRERVMLIECWYKEPSPRTTGAGKGSTYDRNYMRMRCTVITDEDVIYDGDSPYAHNQFPFIPVWCYRRKRDNAPYGVVRVGRGPQDAINKSMSKSIWEVSANQLWIEKDAIDNKVMPQDVLADEMQKPDGMMILQPGGIAKIRPVDRQNKVDGHLKILERGIDTIRQGSSVTGENRGIETSDGQSGKAVLARQEQGERGTAEIFDNLLLSRQMEGELVLSVIEQYAKESRVFGVIGERSKFDYAQVNMLDTETGQVVNDLTARKAYFVVGEQAWRQSLMQAAFESMMQLLGQVGKMEPRIVTAMLAPVMELADVPNKKTLIRAVRQALGQPDPDEPQTPEQQAEAARQQQLSEAQFQAQLAGLRAEVAEATQRGEKLNAEAVGRRVQAMYEAMQAAQVVATVPHVAPIGDEILASAGFRDLNATPTPSPPAAIPSAPIPPAQQADRVREGIETLRGTDNLRPNGAGGPALPTTRGQ